jgi:hypothetical protein
MLHEGIVVCISHRLKLFLFVVDFYDYASLVPI